MLFAVCFFLAIITLVVYGKRCSAMSAFMFKFCQFLHVCIKVFVSETLAGSL